MAFMLSPSAFAGRASGRLSPRGHSRSPWKAPRRSKHTFRKNLLATGASNVFGKTRTWGYRNIDQRRRKNALTINKMDESPTFQKSTDSRDTTIMTATDPRTGKQRALSPSTFEDRLDNRVFSVKRKQSGARRRNLNTANRGGILG